MTSRWGINAAVFSMKCYAAAILAIYLSLSIGLERPYWAFLTSYIVAGPLAGAVISKAIFRVIGTFTGACAAVFMVPPLANSPELLTCALALWVAACVFVSLLDRTPRSYMFVLGGYTALLIVMPAVDVPEQIFEIAELRVQEITIGIFCGTFVHALVFPTSVTTFLIGRVAAIVRDAEQWSRRLLQPVSDATVESERRRLAQDVSELHQLSVHLPFETSRPAPRVRVVRALQDRLSLLLPLGTAVADRIEMLVARDALDEPCRALLADTAGWLGEIEGSEVQHEIEAEQLQARCRALEPEINADSGWVDLMRLSLCARLSHLIDAHLDCRDLAAQLATRDRRPVSARIPALLGERSDRPLHRDVTGGLRGALVAACTILLGSALWIGSQWQDGYTAVMLAGVFVALFASSDNPVIPLWLFLNGTLAATAISTIYMLAILPRLTGFEEFALALAPPLLVLGAMMHSPRFVGLAVPTLIGVGGPFLVSDRYNDNFAAFANGAIAQIVGVVFAIIISRLLQSAGLRQSIRRTLRAGWIDIAERANLGGRPDLKGWIARMLDRAALLGPRLAMAGRDPGEPVWNVLRDLRTGIALGELRQLRVDLGHARSGALTEVLAGTGAYYRRRQPEQPFCTDHELLAGIDRAIRTFSADPDGDVRRRASLSLLSLRRNLFPEAIPWQEAAA